ncbi:MarR family winged helix-turn-helix transcriptional regulator [uncultured Tyzzerella sp.]|uniref:MarR family winged helix-turn-helix transcriptional regulator n=1 Tax=uncultured Tyzzerella sp. TaxID=2321398 RepID=UPI002942737D|nr:MarR family winged helix-turn-helix transcriptional regulator [uncultured Tyzzerella sp.]
MDTLEKKIIAEMHILFAKAKERKYLADEKTLNEVIKKNYNLDYISITEFYIISYIGKEEKINGINLSKKVGMTRGGISKAISSLTKKDLIISYKDTENQKKIYYKLTPLGKIIYEIHKCKNEERNKQIINKISQYNEQEKDTIIKFIKDMQSFLT